MEKVLLVALFTLLIHMAETLAYGIRLAGIRTGKLAAALSLTGIVLLLARTSNMVQGPMTATVVQYARSHAEYDLLGHFRIIIAGASAGTLLAMLLLPTVVSLSTRVLAHLEEAGSFPQMMRTSVTLDRLRRAGGHLRPPTRQMLARLRIGGIPKRLILTNVVVTAIYTIGVLSALVASYLYPDYRDAASQASGLINGVATVLLAMLIDPQVALLTDKVLRGEKSPSAMSKMFGILMVSRLCGTLLAQLLLLPAAHWIAWIVRFF
ncbi:lipid II flippase Amj family protein [Paenibacillus sp. CC-CFT747]|nr:lipid II flippase Amj family protein [Paenibacillus sp. CC-CFT747]